MFIQPLCSENMLFILQILYMLWSVLFVILNRVKHPTSSEGIDGYLPFININVEVLYFLQKAAESKKQFLWVAMTNLKLTLAAFKKT